MNDKETRMPITLFDIVGHGEPALAQAVILTFADATPANGWNIDTPPWAPATEDHELAGFPGERLVLSHLTSNPFTAFLTPITTPQHAARVIGEWLQHAQYPTQPKDTTTKGWRIYCTTPGRVHPYGANAQLAIEPRWITPSE
jgi:hypothetical protein